MALGLDHGPLRRPKSLVATGTAHTTHKNSRGARRSSSIGSRQDYKEGIQQRRQYLGVADVAQYQDKTSESRAAISNNNGGANNELVSSLDLNDQSEFNQMSILAMSQGNIWTQSGQESNKSQIRTRGKSENPTANKRIKLNK